MAVWEDYWKTENRFACRQSGPPMESVIPGRYRQLFIDNLVIEHIHNLRKSIHQPKRESLNPLIEPDQPWEDRVGHMSVIYDETDQCFKMWYDTEVGVCYAVSSNGLSWEKPALGLVEFNGDKQNNLVGNLFESGPIIKDPHDPDPSRRYKYLGVKMAPRYGLYVGWSPDGLRWTNHPSPVLTTDNDAGLNDHPQVMHDRLRQRFIAFTKREINNPFANGDWGMIQRTRCVSISNDFENWTDPVLTLRADDQDEPGFQTHGLTGFNYENTYIGLIDAMHSHDCGPTERTIDVQLACSRDGETWWRAGNRETFIPLGDENAFDQFMVLVAHTPPVRIGDELFFYYHGLSYRHRHGRYAEHRCREPWCGPGHTESRDEGIYQWPMPAHGPMGPTSGMGLARLRVDGFVSIDAGEQPGRLLTRPLLFEAGRLHLNVNAAKGIVRAELFEAKPIDLRRNNWTGSPAWNWAIEDPLPGYSLDDCVPVSVDSTDTILRWENRASLESLRDKMIVIRFELRNASIFSFWLDD